MPTSSEDIKRLKTIDLAVLGYEWQCLNCGRYNTESEFGVVITMVKCVECDANFRVNEY